MRKLSVREKFLIYVAVLLALSAGGYYFEKMPADDVKEAASSSLASMNEELEQQKELIDQIPQMENEKISKEKERSEGVREYPVYQNSNAPMIAELTEIAEEAGLVLWSLHILDMEETANQAGTDVGNMDWTEEPASGSADDSWEIFTVRVKLTGEGVMDQFCKLLDLMDARPWIVVTAFRIEDDGQMELTLEYSMIYL